MTSPLVVRAVLGSTLAPDEPSVGLVQHLLRGLGYDFHDPANQARANDQLLRAKAAELLTEAAHTLVLLEARFREEHVPAATRENPFPPADAMKALKGLDTLRRRVSDLSSTVLAQETPGTDGVWARLRSERALLEQLVAADIGLATSVHDVRSAAEALTVEAVHQRQLAAVETPVAGVEAALRSRRELVG